MKNFKKLFLTGMLIFILGITVFIPEHVSACEIDFNIIKNKQKTYKVDDVLIIKINVTLTHRGCTTGIKKTKIKTKGLTIIGATKWEQKSTMVWERKLKVKVTGTETGELLINATRTCDKEGGFGSMTLKSTPVKKETKKDKEIKKDSGEK